MRKGVGIGLSVLGGFLVVVAMLAQFWAPGQLMKTPLDTDSTTLVEGTAELSDGTGGTDQFPVRAFSVTRADSERSDDDVVVYQNSSCLVKDEGGIDECVSASDPGERLVTVSTSDFATDRVTAEAVNDPKYLPPSATDREGLINKWPFEAEKKDYIYWDGTAALAVDAVYDRTEELEGVETYVYAIDVADAPIEVSEGVPGTYSNQKEIWIEPTTGSIVNQVESQQRLDAEGNPFILLDLRFTDDQVVSSVEDADASAGSLNLIGNTVPLIGFIVGIPALLIGLALQLMSRRRTGVDLKK